MLAFRNRLEAVAGGGIPYALDATAESIRDAINDPASYASGGWRLPGTAGARLDASARASVAMQQRVDGAWEFAPHNLLLNSNTLGTQLVSTVVGAQYTLSIVGTGSVALSGGASGTLAGTGASNRVATTFTATTTSVTFTVAGSVTQAALSLGAAVIAYIPTTSTAVYGPAIDWLSGIGAYGLRSEEARTNLVLWSSDLTNAAWVRSNSGVAVLPVRALIAGAGLDGGAATRFQFDCGNTGSDANRSSVTAAVTVLNALAYSASVWLKAFDAGNVGKTVRVTSDSVGTVVATLTAAWQRVSLTGTSSVTTTNVIIETRGTYTTQTADVLVWCPQFEQGAFATSPILTYNAAATRAADTIGLTDVAWFSQATGTFVGEAVRDAASASGFPTIISLAGTAGNGMGVGYLTPALAGFNVNTGGVEQAGLYPSAVSNARRVAAAYAANDFAVSANGGAVLTDVAGTLPVLTSALIGCTGATTNQMNGHVTRLRYATRRMSNAQLQALTA